MLNHIICLQAVIKIITNETVRALDILAKQHTQVRNAIYKTASPWTIYLSPREVYVESSI
jgi:hypothetical protein